MISMTVITSALELGFIYALVALALFLSFRILNIADMTTDGSFTLGCAVSATVALAGHPFLALPAAMLAGAMPSAAQKECPTEAAEGHSLFVIADIHGIQCPGVF